MIHQKSSNLAFLKPLELEELEENLAQAGSGSGQGLVKVPLAGMPDLHRPVLLIRSAFGIEHRPSIS